MHHTVYLLGNGTLFGFHQHETTALADLCSEYRVGLRVVGQSTNGQACSVGIQVAWNP